MVAGAQAEMPVASFQFEPWVFSLFEDVVGKGFRLC